MFRYVSLAFCLCFFTACNSAAEKPQDIESLRSEIVTELRSLHPDWCFEVDAQDKSAFRTGHSPDDCSIQANVSALHTHISGQPDNRENAISNYLKTLETLDTEQTPEDIKAHLVVLLRPDGYGRVEGQTTIASYPLPGDLDAHFFIDSPTSLKGINTAELEAVGLPMASARELALKNLSDKMGDIEQTPIEGALHLTTASGLAAGIPLLPSSCDPVSPAASFVLVDRNDVLATDLNSGAEALDALAILSAPAMGDNAYSQDIYTCENGAWTAQTHPLATQ